ncbi:zinc finger domain-containing protein [Nocardia wallacei]|uniref:zinc finger domain-containing protein n=1 Tax=Nocardia wallacei TaxID=480035 RepID=UPI0024586731|nr:hypothetical protein [Nocardia wallacei]
MSDYVPLPRPRLGQVQAADRAWVIRTVACPYEPCSAPIGQPCTVEVATGTRHECTDVHVSRRTAARRARWQNQENPDA